MKSVKIIKICDNCGKTFKTTSENRDWCCLKCKSILDQLRDNWLKKKVQKDISRPKHIIHYPLPSRLTNKIKAIIRDRDNFSCQICGNKEDGIQIHNINSNKRNTHPNKLISLCQRCIKKKLFLMNKEYWQNFLKEKIKQNPKSKFIKIKKRRKNEI